MKKVLVIEDTKTEHPRINAAAKEAGCVIIIVTNLFAALDYLGLRKEANEFVSHRGDRSDESTDTIAWDAVITDINFPANFGPSMLDDGHLGLEIIARCQGLGIPVVACTDVHHHHSGWIKRLAGILGAKGVIDDKNTNDDAWKQAFALVK